MTKYKLLFFFLIILITTPTLASGRDFSSFVEYLPQGKIDWDNGYFYGIGRGYPHLNSGSRAKALRVAQADALSSILKVASGLRMDDSNTLAQLEQKEVVIQLKALVLYEPYEKKFKKEGDKSCFEVTYRAKMTGVKGLTARFLEQVKGRSTSWHKFPKPKAQILEDPSMPWLLLDARGLESQGPVNPAVFPEVISEKGETLYELSKVNEEALVKRGMARYVVTGKSREELLSGSNMLRFARVMKILSVPSAEASEKKRRKRRGTYIISDAKEATGLMKTNLVISERDAKRLKKEDAASQILSQCRVMVIVSESLGGIEGERLQFLAFNR